MRFNLSELNPPAWFDHPDHEGSRVCLKILSAADLEKLNKQTMKNRVEYRRGQRFEVESIDEEKRSKLTWQQCIVAWEGIYDEDGKEIECTDENKVLLMQNAPSFTTWVADSLELLNIEGTQREEEAEKN